MNGAELAARVTAAQACLDDFRADLASAPLLAPPPMATWALRLATELGDVLAGFTPRRPDLEHDATELRWLRHRLLNALPAAAEVDRDTADYLAALPGDVCQVVKGWLQQRGPAAATGVTPDGTATLTHADLLLVLGALSDAAAFLEERAVQWCDCDDCAAPPDGLCGPAHHDDLNMATRYRAAAIRLGEDR